MNIQEIVLRRTIPVVINSFNQLFYLENIVKKFLKNGFKNIYIIDQGSTYPPLNTYLENIHSTHPEVFPIFLDENKGPRWFIANTVYHMFGTECFIYTDPDILFETLDENFVFRLIELSHKYKVPKVGSALSLKNLNSSLSATPGKKFTIMEWEQQFWTDEIEPNVYAAPVDTTLHLLNKLYYSDAAFYKAVRVSGTGFEVQHAPWLNNDPMPKIEKEFYASVKNGWGFWESQK